MLHGRHWLCSLLVLGVLAPGVLFAAGTNQGWFCDWFGWLVEPVGWCAYEVFITIDGGLIESNGRSQTSTSSSAAPTLTPVVEGMATTNAMTAKTDTEPRPLAQFATTDYLTIGDDVVTQGQLNDRVVDLLLYMHYRFVPRDDRVVLSPATTSTRPTERFASDDYVPYEYLLKSLDRVYEQIGDIDASSGGGGSVDVSSDVAAALAAGPALVNASFSGTTTMATALALGTTTALDLLTVDGAMHLSPTNPPDPSRRLYNFNDDLYWNGSVISGSSTGNWSATGGDVFRLSGNVGVATNTPTETLTVDGTARITGTTTAPLIDSGGTVCDVRAYGAVGDNATINDAAIAAAIADCPEGGTVFFPLGEFRISQPIVLDRPVVLRGAYSPRWSYSSTPRSSIRADFGSFSGVAMIHVRDRSISGEPEHNNGGRLEHISIDGGSASTDVTGVLFEGLVRDWKLTDVDISQTSGNGFEAAVGAGSGNPRGFTIRGLSIYSAAIHGFRATALNDSYIDDLLAVGNAERGIYLSSMGETKIANSRAVFNGLTGLYIDGSSNNGGLTFTDFSTDRNDRHGVRISASGTSTIVFNGLLTRRDGANQFGGGGSETPYAGVAIIGSSSVKVAPVFIAGLAQTIGVDDSGNPPLAPLTGVRVTNAEYVKIDGQLWGVNEAWRDGGGNDFFIIEDDAILKTGTAGAQELFTNDRKWQSTSTDELIFGNRVHIGSTTDSRLFNIVAPSQVGFRLRDMTNNVTMDARVEDFQAFIGTFSNHQMRFQTNNTSRLTIDTNGYVGIATTSPEQTLQVFGDIRVGTTGSNGCLEDYGGGVIGGTCVSDAALKTDIRSISDSGTDSYLERLVQLRPVTYQWNEVAADHYNKNPNLENLGLIAQDVEGVFPELVSENADGFRQVDFRAFPLYIIEALRELWEVVTGNQERIDKLEERIEQLESELGAEAAASAGDATNEESELGTESGVTDPNDESNTPLSEGNVDSTTDQNSSSTQATGTPEATAISSDPHAEADAVPENEPVSETIEPEPETEDAESGAETGDIQEGIVEENDTVLETDDPDEPAETAESGPETLTE